MIYFQWEDDVEDTIKTRLESLQADQKRIFFLKGDQHRFHIGEVKKLHALINETQAKLLIFDPVFSFLPDRVNPNYVGEILPLLRALKSLAKEKQCAMLLIRHLTKAD